MGQHTSTTTQPVTVVDVEPATLLVDTNVRRDLRVDREFVASIKEHGVLVPIVAIRCDDGIRVRYGHPC